MARGEEILDGGRGRGEEKGRRRFSPSALSRFRFHLSPFPQKRLILRLLNYKPPPTFKLPPVPVYLGFWETAHLPLPQTNINPSLSLRAKWWLRGGVGGQFARNLHWSALVMDRVKKQESSRMKVEKEVNWSSNYFVRYSRTSPNPKGGLFSQETE